MLGIVEQLDVAEAHHVVAAQFLGRDLLAVDPRAVGRAEVLDDVVLLVERQYRVVARNAGVRERNLVVVQPADGEFRAGQLERTSGELRRLRDQAGHDERYEFP